MAWNFAILYISSSVKIGREIQISLEHDKISGHFYEDIIYFSISDSEKYGSTMIIKVVLLVN
jgi:hypothetical protein